MIKIRTAISTSLAIVLFFSVSSCAPKDDLVKTDGPPNLTTLPDSISGLKIYKGATKDLIPNSWYTDFEGASDLFTDSCEKQDLIYIPEGQKIVPPAVGSGLPTFPSGTIFLKTFYYYNDKRNPDLGKKIIETRVILFANGKWEGQTYAWNDNQTNAYSVKEGKGYDISWTDKEGKNHQFRFNIAKQGQCILCHTDYSTGNFVPIGFKMKFINTTRIATPFINQITYFQQIGKMSQADPTHFASVAKKYDLNQPLANRVRGYLAANCAYCHNPVGSAWSPPALTLNLDYETPIDSTGINDKKDGIDRRAAILYRMRSKDPKNWMPKVHCTLIDYQQIDSIEKYFNTLQ
jgi:hypothetical protein